MYHQTFLARVVSVKDPDKSGRVQIRIYGLHDNTTALPDKDCPWARCLYPVTNPVHQGIASGTTGLVVNSTVVGYFADSDRQIPIVIGSLGSSSDKQSDFPNSDRGQDHNDVLGKSIPSIGAASAKYTIDKTIGSITFAGQEIDQLLQQVGGGDIIGAIKSGINVVQQFDDLKNNLINGTIGNLNNIVNGFVSDVNSTIDSTIDNVIGTTPVGNVINLTQSLDSWRLTLFNPIQAVEGAVGGVVNQVESLSGFADTINHLAGNIATRTSKLPINSIDDALGRLDGNRFIMGTVMPSIETSLNKMLGI